METFNTESIIENAANVKMFSYGDIELPVKMNDNGSIEFDAEKAAIGFGLFEVKNGKKYVIWKRVNKYLSTEVSKGDFISESQFYKLAIKANNQAAEKFQDWVTEEVLPNIRKHGFYQIKPLNTQQQIRLLAQGTSELNERLENIEQRMGLPGNMAHEFTQRRNKKIIQVLGGKDSNAYQDKQLRSRTYRAMFAAYKNVFMQDRYNDVPLKRFDEVVKFVGNWFPPYELQSEIQATNAQGNLFKGA
jgi:prophage antirepressor-like protein